MTKLKTICCLCKDDIHDGPLNKEGLVSHGFCERCAGVIMDFGRDDKDERKRD